MVNSRRLILIALFWLGLGLCVFALVKNWSESKALLMNIGVSGAMVTLMLLSASWWLAMESWRSIVKSYSGDGPSRVDASRHLSLLLLGKYIPGGVWGFAARLVDSSSGRSVSEMVASGLFEQWCGFASVCLISLIVWGAAYYGAPIFLPLIVFTPAVIAGGWQLVRRMLSLIISHIPARWRNLSGDAISIRGERLSHITAMIVLQQVLQLSAVAHIACEAFSLDLAASSAVAACYGLAVAAGLAAIFAPGGMLVREATFVAISSHWLSYPQAIAFAAVMRLVFTCFDLMAGFAALASRFIYFRQAP